MVNKFQEFTASSDVYKWVGEKEVLIKSGVSSRILLNMMDIDSIREAIKPDGTLFKTKCIVHHIEMGNLLINDTYKKIKRIKEDYTVSNSRAKIKGFK